MVCASCGTENPADKRFCGDCGAPLAAGCPTCGAAEPARQAVLRRLRHPARRDVPGSGDGPAAAPPLAPVAERRLVSVLFADLVGFTTLAEGRDAEDTRELLSATSISPPRSSARYGGHRREVHRRRRDGGLGRANGPRGRRRARRPGRPRARGCRQDLGPGDPARAGVLTGEAAVTLGATGQGMVAGDLVNTASRLQSVAAPGRPRRRGDPAADQPRHRLRARRRAGPEGQDRAGPGWRALRVVAEVADGTAPRRSRRHSSAATMSCGCSRNSSTPRAGRSARAWSRSSARPGSARRRLAWEFTEVPRRVGGDGLVA